MKDQLRKAAVFIFLLIFTTGFPFPLPANGAVKDKQDIPCVWTGVSKIVAVGDIHGDYENFIKILKGTSMIDDNLNWTGGRTHLVQMGDIMDRGPKAREALDLIKKLEKQAPSSGGKVHMLLGNHEEMNIIGIAMGGPGYVPVEQFVSFLTEDFRKKHETEIRKKFIPQNDGINERVLEAEIKEFWRDYLETHKKSAEEAYFVGFNELYGDWLLKHNAVIRINDIIFSHGGISEKFSTWDLSKINNRYRVELIVYRKAWWPGVEPSIRKPELVYNPRSPSWYRELALGGEEEFAQTVDRILKNLEAGYLVIAHTPRFAQIINRFDGRIWLIDTGISEVYGGYATALVIENGKFIPWGFYQ